jgi:hypothetical protein
VYNIALMDWATRKVTLLTHESTPNHLGQSAAWSPDGRPSFKRPTTRTWAAEICRTRYTRPNFSKQPVT